jgi:hypothetical protein
MKDPEDTEFDDEWDFDQDPAAMGEEPDAEATGEWWGLRNSEPPVTPAEVGTQLDIEAEWWQHLGAGFIKQTGAGGTEAWMHYAMALMLLALSMSDADMDSDGEGGTIAGDREEREQDTDLNMSEKRFNVDGEPIE